MGPAVQQPSAAQTGHGPAVLQVPSSGAAEAALLSGDRGAGTFCVRVGSTGAEVLSLVMSPSAVAHHDVRRLTDTSTRPPSTTVHLAFATGIGPGFPSLTTLLDHYKNHSVNGTGDPVVLRRSLVKQSGGSSREPDYATVDYAQMTAQSAAYEIPVAHNPAYNIHHDATPQELSYAELDGRQVTYSTAQEQAYAGLDGRQVTYSTAAARAAPRDRERTTSSTFA